MHIGATSHTIPDRPNFRIPHAAGHPSNVAVTPIPNDHPIVLTTTATDTSDSHEARSAIPPTPPPLPPSINPFTTPIAATPTGKTTTTPTTKSSIAITIATPQPTLKPRRCLMIPLYPI